ncbi:MAG TPA: TIGR02302 family protein [Rhizomicrobium sp.]|nr:TIGR02302 family protein [Rhizomicrobium sp.]
MNRYLDWIASRLGFKADRIERYIAASRAALLWERVWPALWPASAIVGLFVAAALFDLFAIVPWEIHALIFSAALAGAGTALYFSFQNIELPSWHDGARRLERSSTLEHRPITERDDVMAAGVGDAYAEALWRAHIKRLLGAIGNLRVALPSPQLKNRDPHALRFIVLFAVVVGFIVAGSDSGRRLMQSLAPDLNSGAPPATLDAWINPPSYTGEAPVYLGRALEKPVSVPVGSALVLRVHGARGRPALSLDPAPDTTPKFTGTGSEYGADYRIAETGDIAVRASNNTLGHWRIIAIPDNPPVIAFAKPPARTERDSIALAFTAGDDYGVTSVRALIRPVKDKKVTLIVDLPLDSVSAKTLTQTVYKDLTENPFAGLDVDITLEAKDGAGQTGQSKAVRFHLPARIFTHPLARALIEQRQNLALGGMRATAKVALTLDALTIAPEHYFQNQTAAYMAIRAAYWGARGARYASDIEHLEDLLWQTALGIEGGGLSLAAEELRRLQALLTQALAQGAPQDVIDQLLQKYQEALNNYLQTLAQNPPQSGAPISPNAKVLSEDDLRALLKAIQQLAQSGARGQAAQMLAMLQSLLENLHMTQGNGQGEGQGSPADKALSDSIRGLGDLMGRQRQLLDKTFREQQGNGDPKDGGAKGLAQQEGKLRDDLQKLQKGLQSKNLDSAGRNMGEAQGGLGARDFDSAGTAERSALDALRAGAGELAKNLMQRSGQPGMGENADPMGRTQGSGGFGDGGVKVPAQSELQRARAILQELRRRAAERGRPKEELDYIDRLLKEF